ncbi:MAG: hypothetical protein KIT79_03970 [Deltaproteobacteria bacterium]|nr:hypothetical protein [Deltaproteobacteria bacterium]
MAGPVAAILTADLDDLRDETWNALRMAAAYLVPGGADIALARLGSRGRLVSLRIVHRGKIRTCVVELTVYPAGQPTWASSCQFRLPLSRGAVTTFNWTRRGRALSLPETGSRADGQYPLSMALPEEAGDGLVALKARIVEPRSRRPRVLKIYLEPMLADERPLVDAGDDLPGEAADGDS